MPSGTSSPRNSASQYQRPINSSSATNCDAYSAAFNNAFEWLLYKDVKGLAMCFTETTPIDPPPAVKNALTLFAFVMCCGSYAPMDLYMRQLYKEHIWFENLCPKQKLCITSSDIFVVYFNLYGFFQMISEQSTHNLGGHDNLLDTQNNTNRQAKKLAVFILAIWDGAFYGLAPAIIAFHDPSPLNVTLATASWLTNGLFVAAPSVDPPLDDDPKINLCAFTLGFFSIWPQLAYLFDLDQKDLNLELDSNEFWYYKTSFLVLTTSTTALKLSFNYGIAIIIMIRTSIHQFQEGREQLRSTSIHDKISSMCTNPLATSLTILRLLPLVGLGTFLFAIVTPLYTTSQMAGYFLGNEDSNIEGTILLFILCGIGGLTNVSILSYNNMQSLAKLYQLLEFVQRSPGAAQGSGERLEDPLLDLEANDNGSQTPQQATGEHDEGRTDLTLSC